jgi:uncharacterized protein YeeX (DUF496 family)
MSLLSGVFGRSKAPAKGCKVGAYLSKGANLREKLANWYSSTGAVPKVVCSFHSLDTNLKLDKEDLRTMETKGIIPFLKIEPWNGLDRIVSGEYDGVIERLADDIKEFDGEIRISMGHEMNISAENKWYPWQGVPEEYKMAFRYFAEKIRAFGANNAQMVYNVNVHDPNLIPYYFPGQDVVQIMAVDGYNWGPGQAWRSKWQSFDRIFGNPLGIIKNVAPGKPIMIGEVSSSENGGDKGKWITDTMSQMLKENIESFIWFDIKKEMDWRVDSSVASAKAMREALDNDKFIKGAELTKEEISLGMNDNSIKTRTLKVRVNSVTNTGQFGGDGVSVLALVKINTEQIPDTVVRLESYIVTNKEWPAGVCNVGKPSNEAVFHSYFHPGNQVSPFLIKGFDENGNMVFKSEMILIPFPK